MAFYLKYRPKNIADLDNTEVASATLNYLKRKTVPHAFLFVGPRGTGKTSTARIIAKSVNCLTPKDGLACGTCEICEILARGEHLDILEIDAASNRGIDEVRELREKIKLTPIQLKYKVYIIDEVHMLTTEAFNALLKTLEEPPKHAIFILATTEAHKIPETIVSRCVRIIFHKASHEEILHSLSRAVLGEKLDIEKEALEAIVTAADGSFRDAHKLLEEVAGGGKKITRDEVDLHLGVSDSQEVNEFLKQLHAKNAAALLIQVEKLTSEGKNLQQFFLTILQTLQHVLVELVSSSDVKDWDTSELTRALGLFSSAFAQIKYSVIPSLPFELAIVEYCARAAVPTAVVKTQTPVVSVTQNVITTAEDVSVAPVKAAWAKILEELKSANHSITGVLRSCRPLSFKDGVLIIEAGYKFHAERLNDHNVREMIGKVISNVVGLDTKIEVVLKKR
jgi:DNA polymerase-3 subunit gamma/tau